MDLLVLESQHLTSIKAPGFGGGGDGGGGDDTQAPSVPGSLTVTGTTSGSVSLSWAAASDDAGVAGYDVYRGSVKVGTATATSYTDSGLTAGTAYVYSVRARDAAGNTSAASPSLTATTTSASGGNGGCTAAYTVSGDWGNGFGVDVTVTNTGTTSAAAWKVSWTWAGSQKVTNMWNAAYTQTGSTVSVTNTPYNGSLAPGGHTSFGFQGTPGSGGAPTVSCTLS